MKNPFLLFLLFSALFFSNLGFSESKTEKVLRIRTFGDPLGFDWNRAYTPVEATLMRNLMEGLVEISSTGTLKPALATSWKISADGKTYTFKLRKDVKWSDGVPLKASHFIDSWKRLLTGSFKANYAYLLFDILNAEDFHKGLLSDFSSVGVKAPDDNTLVVTLKNPVAFWIWIPTFWVTFPIRKDLIDKSPSEWQLPGKLVTLGPFKLSSYEQKRQVVLEKNPLYYGKRGNLDKVISALASDDNAAVKLYEDGHLDFVTKISSSEAARVKDRPDFTSWTEARTVYLNFNPNTPPLNQVQLRLAISYAIDRSALTKRLESNYEMADGFLPPGIGKKKIKNKPESPAFDLEKAKLYLKKSGFNAGDPKNNLILGTVGFTDEVMVAEFIRDSLKKNLNIDVKVLVFEPKDFYSPLISLSDVHFLVNRWTADFPDPDNFFSIFLSGSGNNRTRWNSPAYDLLIKKAREALKPKERDILYDKAHELLVNEEAIVFPLYYGQNAALVRPTIGGFKPSPTNSYLFKDFTLK